MDLPFTAKAGLPSLMQNAAYSALIPKQVKYLRYYHAPAGKGFVV
jgi:hypothetical protein